MKRLPTTRLADAAAERARQDHAEAIHALQDMPMARARIVRDVQLADGVATPVAHGLGRAPVFVRESCPRGAVSAGMVTEQREGTSNRAMSVVLVASGWGGTITVDVLVA